MRSLCEMVCRKKPVYRLKLHTPPVYLAAWVNILIQMVAPKEANEIDQHVKAGSFRPEIERNRLGYTSRSVCAELCAAGKSDRN